MTRVGAGLALVGVTVIAMGGGVAAASTPPSTERVALADSGAQPDADIFSQASMTADARYVVFASDSPNLAPGAAGGTPSYVYLRDRALGRTELVSRAAHGGPPNGNSVVGFGPPVISADGRFVAFVSQASNLVDGDTNGAPDVFVVDRSTQTTRRASISSGDEQANGASSNPSISADGRLVVFQSQASNLVDDDRNATTDVFVRDLHTGATTRASVGAGGEARGPSQVTPGAVSADGRYVAFSSTADNLVAGDANGTTSDVFIRDRQAGTTELASLTSTGTQPSAATTNGFVSGDGRHVVFQCTVVCGVVPGNRLATAIFVRDRTSGTVQEVSVSSTGEEATSSVFIGGVSADGLHVSFASNASNLVPNGFGLFGVFDLYLRDVAARTTERVSVSGTGDSGNDSSITFGETISGDGRYVLVSSTATNLVPGDTNGRRDLFLRDRGVTAVADVRAPDVQCDQLDPAPWYGYSVYVDCTASDAGSGLADPADDASFRLTTSVGHDEEERNVSTTSRQVCDVAGNCVVAGPITGLNIDRRAPFIACEAPDNHWHADNVSVSCTALDTGAGLADSADASFTLSTSVPAGAENADAATDFRTVCDAVANCAHAGPLAGIAVDRRPARIQFVGRTAANADGWNRGDVTLEWSCSDDGSGPVQTSVSVTVSTEGDGQSATGECRDRAGNTSTDTRSGINVDTTPPTIGAATIAFNPKAVAQSTPITATTSDALSGVRDGEMFVGADPGPGAGVATPASSSAVGGQIGTTLQPGVYPACIRSRDRAGNWSAAACSFLVVYDPDGGSVTGHGWIVTPAGAYVADPSASGKTDIAFEARYKKGEPTPSGATRLKLKVGDLDFRSEACDWLVVSGARARYTGTGSVNGSGDYGFLATVTDGDLDDVRTADRIRIKIWDRRRGNAIVFDTQPGAPDSADPSTALGGGSLQIRR